MLPEIDPDIRVAATLSADFYRDDRFFELSKERIFARTWQTVAVASLIDNIKPFVLLEGFLGEPLILTRAADRVRCLSNVCTHRGKIVAEADCRATGLRCGYHGRRFDLAGRFVSMPEFEETLNFPSDRDDLAQVPVETWQELAFVSLDPIAPFSDFVSEIEPVVKGLYRSPLIFESSTEYSVDAHWALYCENYLEGFHVPYVHPTLNKAIDYGSYRTELHRYSSVQIACSDDPAATFDGIVAAYYFFVFPNLMLNYYPWGLSVNIVRPVAKERTGVTYLTFVSDGTRRGSGAGADLESVEFEDQAVVESVQRGIRSRFYDRGRYSPTREQGTHHFHRLIAEFIGNV